MAATLIPNSADATWVGTRTAIVVALYFLGVVNGLTDKVVNSIAAQGPLSALTDTFGISIVVILAAVAGLKLAAQMPRRMIDRLDWLVYTIYLAGLCIPRSFTSLAALTFLAGYEAVRNRHSAESTAAASLFIGIAACQLWGKIVLRIFGLPILGVDATLVAGVLNVLQEGGVEHVGNMVETVRGQSLVILPGCSSLSNISYALLCWLAATKSSRPAWRSSDLPVMAIIAIGVITLNVLRMTLMGVSRELYFFIHGPAGTNVTNSLILVLALTAAWLTLARDPASV